MPACTRSKISKRTSRVSKRKSVSDAGKTRDKSSCQYTSVISKRKLDEPSLCNTLASGMDCNTTSVQDNEDGRREVVPMDVDVTVSVVPNGRESESKPTQTLIEEKSKSDASTLSSTSGIPEVCDHKQKDSANFPKEESHINNIDDKIVPSDPVANTNLNSDAITSNTSDEIITIDSSQETQSYDIDPDSNEAQFLQEESAPPNAYDVLMNSARRQSKEKVSKKGQKSKARRSIKTEAQIATSPESNVISTEEKVIDESDKTTDDLSEKESKSNKKSSKVNEPELPEEETQATHQEDKLSNKEADKEAIKKKVTSVLEEEQLESELLKKVQKEEDKSLELLDSSDYLSEESEIDRENESRTKKSKLSKKKTGMGNPFSSSSSRNSWSARDTDEYRRGYPGQKDDPSAQDNWLFYSNQIPSSPDGDYIDNIHNKWWGNYDLLERHHGYIQWLFPIRERGMNWSAQELQKHEIYKITSDPDAKDRVRTSYEMMLDFYGMRLQDPKTGHIDRAPNWKERFGHLNRSFHNYLRITRILKCLGEMGYEHYKPPFIRFCLYEALVTGTLRNTKESCLSYWLYTLRNDQHLNDMLQYKEELLSASKTSITSASTSQRTKNYFFK